VYEIYELAGDIDYLIKVRAAVLREATDISKRLSKDTGVEGGSPARGYSNHRSFSERLPNERPAGR
jgi:hypothetical protein